MSAEISDSKPTSEPTSAPPASVSIASAADKMNGCDVCAVKCWTKEGCLGSYDWRFLCTPQAPCLKKVDPPMYMGKDEKLPLTLSLSFGLQHMLAMCVGIATSGGMLYANEACWTFRYDSQMCEAQSFLVSCSWLASGLLTIIQVFRMKIRGTPYSIGTGLLSVMGTSFTFLPLGTTMVAAYIENAISMGDKRCIPDQPYKDTDQLVTDCRGVGVEAYGKFLGTAMVASLFEVCVGVLFSYKWVRTKLFPPVVVGMAVLMIGGALISSGVKYFGGGVFCAQNMLSRSASFGSPQICNESGEVMLVYGAAQYWGLGLSVVLMGIFIQMLGSPYLKSTFLFWSMMFGVVVSAIVTYTDDDGEKLVYWTSTRIDNAPVITFFWTEVAFVPGFAIEYFLPLLICSFITTAETIGDVKMTAKFSKITDEAEIIARQQGGVLADGINSIIACLCGSPPNTTFSQNNGIIALTKCASRSAGFAAAGWLIFIGLFGKIGAAMASIPMPIVGGVILQCFTMVFVAGMQILGPLLKVRRNSFIVMVALAFGLGVAMEPQLVSAAGSSSFFGKNLDHNYGLWPRYMVCDEFPTVSQVVTPESCAVGNGKVEIPQKDCSSIGGNYTAAVMEDVEVKDCANKNGKCCKKYNMAADSARTALLLILKTPYGFAVIIALVLNLILPCENEDDEEDGEDEVKPKEVEA
uniref:Uncharacterized protein n=1 Tax=Calcidiscus leptoporus TaxID=127549 RepID=A0A7S0JG66_9EUKA|mmetsp:Transcript_54499/g.125611  ORF Transcript_54499/g.125611 Transcript_54499/m.125611 type:complete len:692 (+) Transcript_54499:99-2174(+)